MKELKDIRNVLILGSGTLGLTNCDWRKCLKQL